MKKIDLLHLTFLIVAILSGYSALQYAVNFLSTLAFLNSPYGEYAYRGVFYPIMTIGHIIITIVLVANSRKYASMMLKEDPEGSWDQTSRWELDRHNIIFVLFIGIGLYSLIHAIGNLLSDCIELFSTRVDYTLAGHVPKKSYFVPDLLRLTIAACVIYAAPALTNFIENKIAVRLDGNKQSA